MRKSVAAAVAVAVEAAMAVAVAVAAAALLVETLPRANGKALRGRAADTVRVEERGAEGVREEAG